MNEFSHFCTLSERTEVRKKIFLFKILKTHWMFPDFFFLFCFLFSLLLSILHSLCVFSFWLIISQFILVDFPLPVAIRWDIVYCIPKLLHFASSAMIKCNDVHNKLVVKHSKFNSVNILETSWKTKLNKTVLGSSVLAVAHKTCYKSEINLNV